MSRYGGEGKRSGEPGNTKLTSALAQQISGVWYLLSSSKMTPEEEKEEHSPGVLILEATVGHLSCSLQPWFITCSPADLKY